MTESDSTKVFGVSAVDSNSETFVKWYAKGKGKGDAAPKMPWDITTPQPSIMKLQEDRPGVFGSPLLDIGCGLGNNSIGLASVGIDVVAVDISDVAVEECNARLKDRKAAGGLTGSCQFLDCNILDPESLKKLDSFLPFSTLLDSAVFHCIGNDAARKTYVEALTKLVKPGGHLVMLNFSDKIPDPWVGPDRISESYLRSFINERSGWKLLLVEEAKYMHKPLNTGVVTEDFAILAIAEKLQPGALVSPTDLKALGVEEDADGSHSTSFAQTYRKGKGKGKAMPWDIQKPQLSVMELQAERPQLFESPLLDIGSGLGNNSISLAEVGVNVVGVDISDIAVDESTVRLQAKKAAGGVAGSCEFVECNILDSESVKKLDSFLPFSTVLDSAVFHCIGNDAARRKYVEAFTKLVKPGGHLIMLNFSDKNPDPWVGPDRISESYLRSFVNEESGWKILEVAEAKYHHKPPGASEFRNDHALRVVAEKLDLDRSSCSLL